MPARGTRRRPNRRNVYHSNLKIRKEDWGPTRKRRRRGHKKQAPPLTGGLKNILIRAGKEGAKIGARALIKEVEKKMR